MGHPRITRRALLVGSVAAVAAEAAESYSPWCVTFSPDGGLVAAGCEDGRLRLWDAATRRAKPPPRGHADAVFGVDFAAGGRRIVSCGRDSPRVRIWGTENGELLKGWDAHPGWVWTVRFDP